MDRETLGIIAFPFLFVLLAFRVPIGLAMLIVGSAGTAMIAGWLPIFSQVKTSAWHLFSNYSLSVIPLFLLMGNYDLMVVHSWLMLVAFKQLFLIRVL